MIESESRDTAAPALTAREVMLAGVLAVLLAGAALAFVLAADFTAWDFRNNLWGPAHLLVTGRDPYAIGQLFDGSNAVWLPPVVGAAFPLGWLTERTATNLWTLANIAGLLLVFGLALPLRTGAKPAPVWVGVALTGALLFPPFVSLVILGQISVLVAGLLLLAARLVERDPVRAALLVALATAKPQLLLLAGPGLLVAAYRRGGQRTALRFIGAGLLWVTLLTVPLWAGYPGWLDGFRAALSQNPTWAQPSSLTVLRVSLGEAAGLLAWLVLAVGLLVVTLRLWWHTTDPTAAMSITLGLTLIASPYVWTWDFLLLVPLLVWTLFAVRTRAARLLVVGGYLLAWVATFYIRTSTDNNDVRFWWLPWLLLAIVAVAHWQSRRASR